MFVLLALRLARYISQYAVNLLFWDQWDFLQGLFDGADAWTLFRWQHGPQRQGLGNLVIALTYSATGWNGVVDAAMSGVVMLLAGLMALWLVRRVCGNTQLWDITVPLLFLTTVNAETYAVAPNLAHGPLPSLFLVGFALALTIQSHLIRSASLIAVNFLAVNTGFTLFLGAIAPAILLLLATTSGITQRDRAGYLMGVVASVATMLMFFHGFVPLAATGCFQFPHDQPLEYVPFAGVVLGRPFGLQAVGASREILWSSLAAIGMTAVAAYSAVNAVRYRGNSALWLIAATLIGFSVVFAAGTAVGRICMGIPAANASRYIPYILPALLAIYLLLRHAASSWPWAVLLGTFVVACVVKETSSRSHEEARTYAAYKQSWQQCYLATHEIAKCDGVAGHAVYPEPEVTDLQAKLDWLEARGYNLFQQRERGEAR